MNTLEKAEKRIKEELTPIDQEELYKNMLDDGYGDIEVCGMTFSSRRILEELDPTAYRCGMNDYIDSIMKDGEYYELDDELYDKDEAEAIIEEEEEKEEEEANHE
jgi:hypothetical protein